VKVNELPAHDGLFPDVNAIETTGVTLVVIVIVTAFEVAVVALTHAALEIITQVTICPLVNDEVVNVALFVPAFAPSTFH
jgi:hypothetical protein